MSRTTLSLACLLWVTWSGAASAQTDFNNEVLNQPGMSTLQDFSGGVTLGGSYFQVQNITGDGVGWRNGFTQLGYTGPWWLNEDFLVAANGRLMITDHGQIGGNLGAFARYYNWNMDRIFGGNVYYDIDNSARLADYQYRQVGFGLETLGQWWDFRANGYVPIDSGNQFVQGLALGNDLTYFGNRVGLIGTGQYEEALWGGDWEFGVPLTPYTPWLRGYAGMYMYSSKGTEPIGVRSRVEGWVSDDLNIGLQVTNDRQFGTNVNATVNFLFSGWKPTRYFPQFTTHERMLIPVQRNWRIVAGTYEQLDYVPAYNPRTNQPYFVSWVDNSAAAPGNGTYETPYTAMQPTFPDADLILVRTGNTSALQPLLSSVVLSDWQRMLGEGREHQFQAYFNYGAIHRPTATYNLPEFTNTGLYPYLAGPLPIVSLADNNEVSAFNMMNSLGPAITNNALAGSQNFNLNYLNLRGNLGGGVSLLNASGNGIIDHVTAIDNLAGGIRVDSGTAPLVLTMNQVASNSTLPGAQLFGVAINAVGSDVTANLTDVTANRNGTGIALSEGGRILTANMLRITAEDNVGPLGDGIRAVGVGGRMNLNLDTVSATGNGGRGIFVSGMGTVINFQGVDIDGSNNVGDNINFTISANSVLDGFLADSFFDSSGLGSGIVFNASASDVGSLADPFLIRNVSASGNFVDGLSVSEALGSLVALYVDPTHLDGNFRDGFHFNVQDGSTLAVHFEQDSLNDNGRSAVFGNVDLLGTGNSVVSLQFTDTYAIRSGGNGLDIQSGNGADIFVSMVNGGFSDSGQLLPGSSGLRFDGDLSNIQLELINAPSGNSNGYGFGPQAIGLQVNLTRSQFQGDIVTGNFSGNLQEGILANFSDNSTAVLNLTDVLVNSNGDDGLQMSVSDGSTGVINAAGNTRFVDNGRNPATLTGNGMNVSVDGTAAQSRLDVYLPDIILSGNRGNGILATASGTDVNMGLLNLFASDGTSIRGNRGNGVSLVNNAGVIRAFFEDTDISFNQYHGVKYEGAGRGAFSSEIDFSHFGAFGVLGTTDNNQGAGFSFRVTDRNTLALTADSVSFSGNQGAGIQGYVDGLGSFVTINPFLQVVSEFNGREGLNLLADHEGRLLGNVNGGSFSNNGLNGVFDGVHVVSDHSAYVTICFDGTVVDNNTGNGFNFEGHNNAFLLAGLQSSGQFGQLSAANNGLQPFVFTLDSGASGGLVMTGDNFFGGGNQGITFSVNGANTAIFSFSGTIDNTIDDAINVSMVDVANAYIDIHGPGSLSGNGGNGIDIFLDNVTFGGAPITPNFLQPNLNAIPINPFNISDLTISDNGEEGIKIVGTDVTMPVGTIVDNVIFNNNADGVLIDFTGGNNQIGTLTIDGNDISSNLNTGLNIQLSASSSINTLTITNNNATSNLDNGIYLNLNGSSINNLNISNNDLSGSGTGGGPTPSGFNIDVVFNGGLTASQQAIFATAAARWSEIITGDLVDVGAIDDLTIVAEGAAIDGVGGILGQAGPTAVRPISFLPYSGIMQFDTADLADMESNGTLLSVILHEMAHVMGFGTIWDDLGLLSGGGTANPIFTGVNATAEYNARFGTAAAGVPVENTGGPGTVDSHWRETVYTNELMTGFISGATQPISRTTVGQFEDLGYDVDYTEADPFLVSPGGAGTPIHTGSVMLPTMHVGTLAQLAAVAQGPYAALSGSLVTPASSIGDGIHIEMTNSTINNTVINNNTISNGSGFGINYAAVTNSTLGTTTISNNTISTNAAGGIEMNAAGSTVNTLSFNGNTIDANEGDGIRLAMTGTPINTLNVTNNVIRGNDGNGVNLDLNQSPIGTLNVTGNDISRTPPEPALSFLVSVSGEHWNVENLSGNGVLLESLVYDFSPINYSLAVTRGAGMPFEYWFGGVETGFNSVNGLPVDLSQVVQPGVISDGETELTLGFTDFDNNDFNFHFDVVVGDASATNVQTGNDLAGVTATAFFSNGESLTGTFDGNNSHTFTRAGTVGDGNSGDGIRISQVDSNIGEIVFDNNNITGNGGNGINFATVSNSNIGPMVVSNNTIDENGGDGFRLVDPDTINKTLDIRFTDNTSISGNGGNGVNLQITQNDAVTLNMTGNTIGAEGNGNGGMGVRAVFTGTASLNATIGVDPNTLATAPNANSFTGNADAGFGLIMSDNTTGSLIVRNSSFNGSVNGSDANFAGVGLGVILRNNAQLSTLSVGDVAAQNTDFIANASHGFQLDMSDNTSINSQVQLRNLQADANGLGPSGGSGVQISLSDFANIPDLLVTGTRPGSSFSTNGTNGFQLSVIDSSSVDNVTLRDVTANGNGADGLQFLRAGSAALPLVTIDNATATGNTGDGLQITAGAINTVDTYVITDSDFSDNVQNGVLLTNIADSDLFVDISNTTINGNGLDGIRGVTVADVTDSPTLLLSVADSTINDNDGTGINIFSAHLVDIDNNTISGNGVDGINLSGGSVGIDQITDNIITLNGDDGIDISASLITADIVGNTIESNGDNGIEMVSDASFGGHDIVVDDNTIRFNEGDGVQISASNGSSNSYVLTGNRILSNDGRGINFVNGGGTNGLAGGNPTSTDLEISGDNQIAFNGMEGVRIINTASETQGSAANIDGSTLLEDGSVFARPLLNLIVDGNDFNSNGASNSSPFNATGLVLLVGTSDASNSFSDPGGFAGGGRGGVIATVSGNTFSGNFAADVTFAPFISTVDPATTSGDWTDQADDPPDPSNDQFLINPGYQSDPLARLDLTFQNNTGNGLIAANSLAGTAFYNNDESVFKSRVTAPTQSPGGPFNSGTRARNATRLAFRGGAFSAPALQIIGTTGQDSDDFLYPGVAPNSTPLNVNNGSTFRVDATGNSFSSGTSFTTGIFVGADVGELPFVWGLLP